MTNKLEIIKNLIKDGGRATFATIVAKVPTNALKRRNPFPNSEKVVEYHVLLNGVYKNAVNNQREREGKEADFVAVANWHKKVFDGKNGSIVTNKSGEKFYLMTIVSKAKVLGYFDANGNTLEHDQVKPFLPKNYKPENQGLEKDVIVRTISLDNIQKIVTNNETLVFD